MPGDPIAVPLRSRRAMRRQTAQKLQHVVPAFGLLTGGVQLLGESPHGFVLGLAVAEVVVSAVLIVTMARALRATRRLTAAHDALHEHRHGHAQVDWVDIWTSAMLFTEGAERYHIRHKIIQPAFVTAFVTLGLGLFHGRLHEFIGRRRALRVTDEEVYVSVKPFRTWRARWSDITAIAVTDRVAEITLRGGRVRRIDLTDLLNADQVKHALAEVQRRLESSVRKD